MIINGDQEYKQDEYIHFVREYTGETKTIATKKGSRTYNEYEMREVPFEDIVSINLNKSGESVPFTGTGVINLNRYLFWYWTPILDADTVSLYILLTEYCDDDTDICYPKEKELADRLGISRPTVSKKLKILQENNFILIINRLNKLANNKETSPIYKIRQTIPLLSKEQYNQLPDYLKKKHDKFMMNYGRDAEMTYFHHSASSTMDSLLANSEKMISKKRRAVIDKSIADGDASSHIMSKLSNYQVMASNKMHDALEDHFSTAVRGSIFLDAICIQPEATGEVELILCDLGKEMATMNPTYEEKLLEIFTDIFNEDMNKVNYYTFKEYIYKMERGE